MGPPPTSGADEQGGRTAAVHARFWDGFADEFSVPARRLTPRDVLRVAELARARGWSGVWLSEVLSLDAAVLLGAVAQACPGLRLGTSIVPLSTRSAALLAMMAATVAGLAPGRFALGVGVSTPAIVDERHDRAVRRPVAQTRGVLSVVREALAGRVVEHPSDPRVRRLRLDAPEHPPPVLLAALGPQMVEVARRSADGLILNLVPPAVAARLAEDGRREVGPGHATLLTQRVCVTPSAEDLHAVRHEIASYCRVPVYAASIERCGWDLAALRAAPEGEAGRLLPEDLLHELVVLGSPRECRARLDDIAATGVRPVVVPVGAGDSATALLERLPVGT